MRRVYIIVEGQTEREFVQTILSPYLYGYGINDITPILIHTSMYGRGGFVNYIHLRKEIKRLLLSTKQDFIVTMFVDFFRCPDLPNKEKYENISQHTMQVEVMEKCIYDDINDPRFIPYIQLHEFEALLFSSNKGFESYLAKEQSLKTKEIIEEFINPEDINTSPQGAPSKRLLVIKNDYEKIIDGNLIAMEIGIDTILNKCPRFRKWIERIIQESSKL